MNRLFLLVWNNSHNMLSGTRISTLCQIQAVPHRILFSAPIIYLHAPWHFQLYVQLYARMHRIFSRHSSRNPKVLGLLNLWIFFCGLVPGNISCRIWYLQKRFYSTPGKLKCWTLLKPRLEGMLWPQGVTGSCALIWNVTTAESFHYLARIAWNIKNFKKQSSGMTLVHTCAKNVSRASCCILKFKQQMII